MTTEAARARLPLRCSPDISARLLWHSTFSALLMTRTPVMVVCCAMFLSAAPLFAQACSPPDNSLDLALGLDVTRATVDQEKYDGDVGIILKGGGCNRISATAISAYDEKNGKITRKHSGEFFYQFYLGGGVWSLSPAARLLHNNLLGVGLQEIYSLTLSRRFSRDSAKAVPTLSISAGPAFVRQDFIPETSLSRDYPAGLMSVSLNWKFDPRNLPPDPCQCARKPEPKVISITPALLLTEPFEDGGSRIATSQLTVEIPLYRIVGLSFRIIDEYISNPPPNFDSHYTNTSLKITFTF